MPPADEIVLARAVIQCLGQTLSGSSAAAAASASFSLHNSVFSTARAISGSTCESYALDSGTPGSRNNPQRPSLSHQPAGPVLAPATKSLDLAPAPSDLAPATRQLNQTAGPVQEPRQELDQGVHTKAGPVPGLRPKRSFAQDWRLHSPVAEEWQLHSSVAEGLRLSSSLATGQQLRNPAAVGSRPKKSVAQDWRLHSPVAEQWQLHSSVAEGLRPNSSSATGQHLHNPAAVGSRPNMLLSQDWRLRSPVADWLRPNSSLAQGRRQHSSVAEDEQGSGSLGNLGAGERSSEAIEEEGDEAVTMEGGEDTDEWDLASLLPDVGQGATIPNSELLNQVRSYFFEKFGHPPSQLIFSESSPLSWLERKDGQWEWMRVRLTSLCKVLKLQSIEDALDCALSYPHLLMRKPKSVEAFVLWLSVYLKISPNEACKAVTNCGMLLAYSPENYEKRLESWSAATSVSRANLIPMFRESPYKLASETSNSLMQSRKLIDTWSSPRSDWKPWTEQTLLKKARILMLSSKRLGRLIYLSLCMPPLPVMTSKEVADALEGTKARYHTMREWKRMKASILDFDVYMDIGRNEPHFLKIDEDRRRILHELGLGPAVAGVSDTAETAGGGGGKGGDVLAKLHVTYKPPLAAFPAYPGDYLFVRMMKEGGYDMEETGKKLHTYLLDHLQ
eukprot:gene23230-30453_t